MAKTRRDFLRTGTMLVLSAGIPAVFVNIVSGGQKVAKPQPQVKQNNLDYFTRTTFTPYVNTTFQIQVGRSAKVALTLIQVIDLKAASKHPERIAGRESFSLLFHGPSTKRPADSVYTLEHAALGKFALFVVAGGKSVVGQYYEAIITRM